MNANLQTLVELCNYLEPLIRPLGWHCAATGSALYGQTGGLPPEDLDILLYRHSGWTDGEVPWRPFDVLLAAGFRKIEDCTEYPDFERQRHSKRKVFRVRFKDIKVDFLCIDELC